MTFIGESPGTFYYFNIGLLIFLPSSAVIYQETEILTGIFCHKLKRLPPLNVYKHLTLLNHRLPNQWLCVVDFRETLYKWITRNVSFDTPFDRVVCY